MNQVLICADDNRLIQPLTEAAQHAGLGTLVAIRASLALRVLNEHQPPLVLIDQAFEGGTGIDVAANMVGLSPRIRVAMLVRQGDFELTRAAMHAGVADILLVPSELPRVKELLSALNHSVETESNHAEGRVAAFFGPRGGVGSSFLSVNVAVACTALVSGPVLLVDGNMQKADLNAMLDIKGERSVADLLPVLDELTPAHIRNVCASHQSGVQVLLAPPDPMISYTVQPEHLARVVRIARRHFAAVIIDCPPLTDERCAALLSEASLPILVATPDAPDIIAWRRLRLLAGQGSGRVKLLANQVHSKCEIAPKDMATAMQMPLLAEVRLDVATVTPIVNVGGTLFDTTTSRRGRQPAIVQDVVRVAKRLLA